VSTPVLGAAASAGPAGASAAVERMQHLRALIAQVEEGPTGFAAALGAAQASPAATEATTATASPTTVAGAEGATATYQSPSFQNPSYQGPSSLANAPATLDAADTSTLDTAGTSTLDATGNSAAGAPGGGAYGPLIEQAAARNGIDPAVLYGLIEQESGFDPNATSGAGAVGLTQLMPSTAASLGVTEPFNPEQSIEGGARYLGEMLRQFGGNTVDALAAYNAGPGAVQQYGGVPPYAETQQYVSDVLANAAAYRPSAAAGVTEIPSTAASTASATPATAATIASSTASAIPAVSGGVAAATSAAIA
jgi:soluble lytic murein transglycosylase-like protein